MQPNPGAKAIVWWVLWASFLGGLPVMYFVLGPKARAVEPAFSGSTWVIGALPVAGAMLLRWTVLPRMHNATAALPMFLVGIALCEASLFFGLFIFPDHARTLFICSLLGTIQFAPVFAPPT
jgi:hypothetical protein